MRYILAYGDYNKRNLLYYQYLGADIAVVRPVIRVNVEVFLQRRTGGESDRTRWTFVRP